MNDVKTNIEQFLIFKWFLKHQLIAKKVAPSYEAHPLYHGPSRDYLSWIYSAFLTVYPSAFSLKEGNNTKVEITKQFLVNLRENFVYGLESGLVFLAGSKEILNEALYQEVLEHCLEMFQVFDDFTQALNEEPIDDVDYTKIFIDNLLREPNYTQIFSDLYENKDLDLSTKEKAIFYLYNLLAPLSAHTKRVLAAKPIRTLTEIKKEVYLPERVNRAYTMFLLKAMAEKDPNVKMTYTEIKE